VRPSGRPERAPFMAPCASARTVVER
jgi:hypothetical protein